MVHIRPKINTEPCNMRIPKELKEFLIKDMQDKNCVHLSEHVRNILNKYMEESQGKENITW